MWGIVVTVIDILITGMAIWSDYETAKYVDDKVSQVDSLIQALQGQMTFSEFVSECWLIIAFLIGVAYLCLFIAFPKQKKKAVRA